MVRNPTPPALTIRAIPSPRCCRPAAPPLRSAAGSGWPSSQCSGPAAGSPSRCRPRRRERCGCDRSRTGTAHPDTAGRAAPLPAGSPRPAGAHTALALVSTRTAKARFSIRRSKRSLLAEPVQSSSSRSMPRISAARMARSGCDGAGRFRGKLAPRRSPQSSGGPERRPPVQTGQSMRRRSVYNTTTGTARAPVRWRFDLLNTYLRNERGETFCLHPDRL